MHRQWVFVMADTAVRVDGEPRPDRIGDPQAACEGAELGPGRSAGCTPRRSDPFVPHQQCQSATGPSGVLRIASTRDTSSSTQVPCPEQYTFNICHLQIKS